MDKRDDDPDIRGAARDEGPDSARRREVILTAGRLFREHGYERTTVRELAKAVGLQSGSLFHHFRSKGDPGRGDGQRHPGGAGP